MKYRREIDGLRAVAVLPVIFFHAGFKVFQGGFVGVDVFFVISGYLITTIILSDMNDGKFSIITFYERRARRILPVLFFVMLCCLPFAWFWLLPNHQQEFSESLAAVSAFSSNILFWREEGGYFGVASELKPLLHTWSLAVEEQYYLLFPLFLMVFWKLRKRWIFGALIFVGALSLVVAQWGAYNHPYATFFLLPTRGWELAIGALIAFYFLYRREHADFIKSRKKTSEFFGVIGLLLICYSIFAFDKNTPFPSLYALVPTLGTGLIIIFTTPETFVGRFLGIKPMVGIGLLSYSAYLWHHPLFVFARHRSVAEPDNVVLIVLSVLTFFLAYLSWRFVENPFRNKNLIGRNGVFAFAVIGSLAFAAVGFSEHVNNGFNSRENNKGVLLSEINEKIEFNVGLSSDCNDEFTLSDNCRTSNEPEILLWGDSYAMHLAQGILESNPKAKVIQMTKFMCGPFFSVAHMDNKRSLSWAKECVEFNDKVKDWLKENNSVKYVVLSSLFSQYLYSQYLLVDGEVYKSDNQLVTSLFVETLKELEGLGVTPIVFSPTPRIGRNIGSCLAKNEQFDGDLLNCNFSRDDIVDVTVREYDFLRELPEEYRVVYLDEGICKGDSCSASNEGVYIYRDSGHLSKSGSAWLGKSMGFYDLIVEDASVICSQEIGSESC